MEKSINQRYVLTEPILPMLSGMLYSGKDLPLRRDVVFFVVESTDEAVKEAYIRKLREVAPLSDNRFLHILDVGMEPNYIFAVLKTFDGKPFIQELKGHRFTPEEAVSKVLELGKGLMDALEEGISGCSVHAANLWLSDDGQLKIINYWEKGTHAQRGAQGLGCLLYQILTRSESIPVSFDSMEPRLREALSSTSRVEQDLLIATLRRVWNDQETLASFMLVLQSLRHDTAVRQDPVWDRQVWDKKEPERVDKEEDPAEKEEEEQEAPPRRSLGRAGRKLLVGTAIACLGGAAAFVWLGKDHEEPSGKSASPAQTEHRAPVQPTHQTYDKPAGPEIVEASDPNQAEAEIVIVPNLIGLQNDTAGKQAIAAGLRFEFAIVVNEREEGTVFKQEPAAHTQVPKGTEIKYWVSKGKQQ
ncbi:Stk1 family PASTA domain-containing Ser/Thr kinase [Paenibacillus ehimensis]|uniref:PASTA domain-containing protein n=1 Tax=Paenibacillus ehimensis TaxID=79264 RepID=A0ABT8VL56_9BACL|nr:Stk1 family PASTA domain-containing Ser/Thr kinase [Paenibacillus ehimensis]MDO3681713.1 PASTA domain-containing protein [Paenibacillus ehimensis]